MHSRTFYCLRNFVFRRYYEKISAYMLDWLNIFLFETDFFVKIRSNIHRDILLRISILFTKIVSIQYSFVLCLEK